MLTKGFHESLPDEDLKLLLKHSVNIQKIAYECWYQSTARGDMMPSCHEVATSYGLAFNIPIIHGRKIFVCDIKHNRFFDIYKAGVYNYPHSWNLLPLPSGESIILDLFPNESCSLVPLIVKNPNPAYHAVEKIEKMVLRELTEPTSTAAIDYFTNEFKRIVA